MSIINEVVQATRDLANARKALEVAREAGYTDALEGLNRRCNAIADRQQQLTVEALNAGVQVETLQFAVGMNDSVEKVQAQQIAAQMIAASVATAQEDDVDEP